MNTEVGQEEVKDDGQNNETREEKAQKWRARRPFADI